jgi:hypothetical protein
MDFKELFFLVNYYIGLKGNGFLGKNNNGLNGNRFLGKN